MFPPSRIVYLTEETVETLYLIASRTASSGSPAMSRARLKHSLTAPAYSEQRSTLAKELGLGQKSTPAVASAPATGEPGERAGRDEPPNRGGPVVPAGRENIVASGLRPRRPGPR
jgi:hypothetical protein